MAETNIDEIMSFTTDTIRAGARSHSVDVEPTAIDAFLAKYRARFERHFNQSGVGLPGWRASRDNIQKVASAHGAISAIVAGLQPGTGRVTVTEHVLMEVVAPLIENQCRVQFGPEGPWCT
jgi:hypothetical protein